MNVVSIEHFPIPGPLLVKVRRFEDARGFFSETYNARAFSEAGIKAVFVQDNHSLSRDKGTVRGLHFQRPPHAQDKLIRVLRGRILDVAVDIRRGSPTYGEHVAVELDGMGGRQLYIPAGFAHGFCTLVPDTEVFYKVTDFWMPDSENGVLWNDPALAIDWPDFAGAQLAAKDTTLAPLAALDTPFTWDRTK